jgi:hypothetical protein
MEHKTRNFFLILAVEELFKAHCQKWFKPLSDLVFYSIPVGIPQSMWYYSIPVGIPQSMWYYSIPVGIPQSMW